MPTPIPFADDGGTPAWRARHTLPTASRFPIWRFLLAVPRTAALAGVHGSGVLAGLDVLLRALWGRPQLSSPWPA